MIRYFALLLALLAACATPSRAPAIVDAGSTPDATLAEVDAEEAPAGHLLGSAGPVRWPPQNVLSPPDAAGGTKAVVFVADGGVMWGVGGGGGGGVTSVTATTPLASTGGTTPVISIGSTIPLVDVASPTGSGFPHVTSGAWDTAARAVNVSGADITGIEGVANGGSGANLSGCTSGQLVQIASGPIFGCVTAGGDVTVAAGGAYTVTQLQGGRWTLSSTGQPIFAAAYSSAGQIHGQAAPTSDLATGATEITPSSAYASATTNRTGGELDLYGGAGATTNGTGGNVDVVLAPPSGTGTEASFNIDRGLGTHAISFNPATGLWTFGSATTAPGLAQASESATQTPIPMTIAPQVSTHSTNQDGSELLIPLSAALGSGADSKVLVTRGGYNSFQTGGDLNGHTCVWLDQSAPSYANCDLRKVSTDLWMVPPGSIRFIPDQSNVAIFNGATGEASFGFNVAVGAFSGGTYGGGTATTYWANGTPPTSACTGGACLSAAGGLLVHTDANGLQAAILTGYATITPSNGANTLSATNSGAAILVLAAGASAAVTVSSTLTPAQAKGALLTVRNNTSQTVSFGWQLGTTCSFPASGAGVSQIVTSDGTNCKTILNGT